MITKSDFKVFLDCPYKLKYKKLKYPMRGNANEYLEFLADGGFMVEAIARAVFGEGLIPEEGQDEEPTAATTRALQKAGSEAVYEASFQSGSFFVRADIVKRNGSGLDLIEIKSKSYDPEEDEDLYDSRGGIRSDWREYVYDAAFQTMVIQRATGLSVTPHLCVVDKTKVASSDAIYSKIHLKERQGSGKFTKGLRAFYTGDSESLKSDNLLAVIDISTYVNSIMADVEQLAESAAEVDETKRPRTEPPLKPRCKDCEFRTRDKGVSGFEECWGSNLSEGFHIVDLYYANAVVGGFEQLVESRDYAIDRIPMSSIKQDGARGRRQMMQIQARQTGEEVVDRSVIQELSQSVYPLFFLDFETSRIPVPYHVGMNPYEQVPFQFSCHVIENPSSTELKHFEWINVDDVYPSEAFTSALREVLGSSGTVFVWSPFEQAALRDIVRQNQKYGTIAGDLISWIDGLHLAASDGGRIVDLMKVCIDSYCHPDMGGRVSIKNVLGAIWTNTPSLHTHPWFSDYVKRDEAGTVLAPYAALADVPKGVASEAGRFALEAVRDGVGAMRAYQQMLYGLHRNDAEYRELALGLLRQYCRLDTLAMVIIWSYWTTNCV